MTQGRIARLSSAMFAALSAISANIASSLDMEQVIAQTVEQIVRATNADGVVEYSSVHIEPVESELVVQPSSHSTQGNPKTIEEVRRILRLHADVKGT